MSSETKVSPNSRLPLSLWIQCVARLRFFVIGAFTHGRRSISADDGLPWQGNLTRSGLSIHDRYGRLADYRHLFPRCDRRSLGVWANSGSARAYYGGSFAAGFGEGFAQDPRESPRRLRAIYEIYDPGHADSAICWVTVMTGANDLVFVTKSTADFGFTEVYLTYGRRDHISLGHRDLAEFYLTIKEAVERTTHAVAGNQPNRIVFYSTEVKNKSGKRPLAVVVERNSGRGEIITSTWKDKVKGRILWESTNGFYADFDEGADILYVSKGPATEAYAVEDDNDGDIWYRKSDIDDSPVGVTVFRARERELKNAGWIARVVSAFLGLTQEQISERIDLVMPK